MGVALGWILVHLVCGALSSSIAYSRQRSGVPWFFLGLFLGPIGLILALLTLRPPQQEPHDNIPASSITRERSVRSVARQQPAQVELRVPATPTSQTHHVLPAPHLYAAPTARDPSVVRLKAQCGEGVYAHLLHFSPIDKRVIGLYGDGVLASWDRVSGVQTGEVPTSLWRPGIDFLTSRLSPNGLYLTIVCYRTSDAGATGTVIVDLGTGHVVRHLPSDGGPGYPERSLSISPDGKTLALSQGLYRFPEGLRTFSFEYPDAGDGPVTFLGDGRSLLRMRASQRSIVLWDIAARTVRKTYVGPNRQDNPDPNRAGPCGVFDLFASEDGRFAICTLGDGFVWKCDLSTSGTALRFHAHRSNLRHFACSRAGHLIATSGYENPGDSSGYTRLWSGIDGALVWEIPQLAASPMEFSENADYLALTLYDSSEGAGDGGSSLVPTGVPPSGSPAGPSGD